MGERQWPQDDPPPDGPCGPDPEWDEYVSWLDGEIAAGRDPDEDRAFDTYAAPLASLCDPEGLAGEGAGALFKHGAAGETLPPGPVLDALAGRALAELGELSDQELIGVLQASRRLEAREAYRQTVLINEYARRQETAFEEARARGVPSGVRPGGYPGDELAMELVTTRISAGRRIDDAKDLLTRLPATLAGMAAGLIDATRADYIVYYTRSLADADAAYADRVLAEAAPDLRADQVARKAAALEAKLDPEGVKARKEEARKTAQRVEARREASGNASLAGREMETATVMASKAYIDAVAVKLRNGGLDGPIGALRALALADLTQGRNPLDRLRATPVAPASPVAPADDTPTPGYAGPEGWPGWDPGEAENARYGDPLADELDDPARRAPVRSGAPVPLPALVNILVPAGTLLGWSAAPAQAGTWGLLDRGETGDIIKAAALHPRTRWCITLTGPDGRAIAHGCARGQHPQIGTLVNGQDGHPARAPGQPAGVPDVGQAARLAELLRGLNVTFTPVAEGGCDHGQAEDRYTPSRRLKHLVRARSATCDAPACGAQASYADLDHTIAYPDGPTDQCNLGPRCRRHHRAKQAPDWKVEQPEPGVIRWTLPSGRVHVTPPTRYEL